ncbi:hypothetical protein DFJ73DRAFT_549943 [Zopfochytrium polystomum]|nr:hypothetical protein DFJ73DRAFT_549943 [Zopfochytrium polystomum]
MSTDSAATPVPRESGDTSGGSVPSSAKGISGDANRPGSGTPEPSASPYFQRSIAATLRNSIYSGLEGESLPAVVDDMAVDSLVAASAANGSQTSSSYPLSTGPNSTPALNHNVSPMIVDLEPNEAASENTSSAATAAPPGRSPTPSTHHVAWSVAAEKGYQTMRTVLGEFLRGAIHPDLEDIHWPTLEERERVNGSVEALKKEESETVNTLWSLEEALLGSEGLAGVERRRKRKSDSSDGRIGNDSTEKAIGAASQSQSASSVDEDGSRSGADAQLNPASPSLRKHPRSSEHLSQEEMDSQRVALQARYQLHLQAANALTSCARHSQYSTTAVPRVFVLADGHGGIRAARFFVPRARDLVYKLIASKRWDLNSESDRWDWVTKIEPLFAEIDAEYIALQVEAYRKWKEEGAVHAQRPLDDGCTLVVTVIMGGWVVSMNVGDSRTVIYSRSAASPNESIPPRHRTDVKGDSEVIDASSNQSVNAHEGLPVERTPEASLDSSSAWSSEFSSVDHNMSHSGKVWEIHQSGGQFICPPGAPRPVQIEPPESRQHRPYHELNGGRIFRQSSDPVKAVGVSHRRTLNLTATMGDLLFKINPPVLSPRPDIHFMKLESDRDYVVVMATDGVWDHLLAQGSEVGQNEAVLKVVAAAVAAGEAEDETAGENRRKGMMFRLLQGAACLAYREAVFDEEAPGGYDGGSPDGGAAAAAIAAATGSAAPHEDDAFWRLPRPLLQAASGMYARRLPRYDDATAFIVLLRAEKDLAT